MMKLSNTPLNFTGNSMNENNMWHRIFHLACFMLS